MASASVEGPMSDLATVELELGWDDQAEELALLSGAKLGWPTSVLR